MSTTIPASAVRHHQQLFTEQIQPIVERHARVVFRNLRRRPDDLAEAIADCVAHAWEGYLSLIRRGKQPWAFPTMLATFAAQRTKVGRKVGKEMNAKDVYNAAYAGRTRLEHPDGPSWHELMADDMQTPVPDQVAFRIDFPAWLDTLAERQRDIAEMLLAGCMAGDVAKRFGLSNGRVTQIRQELIAEWERYTA
jgi:DNA-directed RNA polymerase specialized sigma24 family protein